ncbi:type IV pilus modification protein PilV [Thiocystis violacea]|uniref:type IV pilus modification protein PilV n=1 Tax=Thiocystis violacea TaxID=13725 RepID=UPI001904DA60|nr:type IV pilus modification protein PilV [Thiocystis violacea]MBK1719528.1 type IV pilus modification protein PilV [Thiocystis violacea]
MKAIGFRANDKHQQGFTLIEVLIAALVLSIGLLGLAGLQAISQKLNYSAYQRSQAASLAYEIADAIRANAANASGYVPISEALDDCDEEFSRSDIGPVAKDDLSEWENRISCLFSSSAQREIELLADSVRIKISWDESRARAIEAGEEEPDDQEDTDSGEDLRDEFEITIQL